MLEVHYYWIEIFLDRCNIELSEYESYRGTINRNFLEKHFDKFIDLVDESKDIAALQTLVVLILETGAKLPDNLKRRVLKSLNWVDDNSRYHWSPYVINVRKIYLKDFENKILNHRTGLKTFLIDLKIHYDKDLEHILIGVKQLKSFVREEKCVHINNINLDSCGLLSIPEVLTKFPNLTLLSLNNNYITSFPDFIDNFSNLKKLYLMNNKIQYISSNVCSLSNLESIYLSYNHIQALPSSLKNLKNLRALYLDNNNIQSLPNVFDNLENLKHFDLRNNPVKNIPSSLKEYPDLKGIYSTFY